MALGSLGYRYGHTAVWQMVALYKEAQPRPQQEARAPRIPAERPQQATVPHQVWCVDGRYMKGGPLARHGLRVSDTEAHSFALGAKRIFDTTLAVYGSHVMNQRMNQN